MVYSYSHSYIPLKCKNEYLVLALGEETAIQTVVFFIVWVFRGLKKRVGR